MEITEKAKRRNLENLEKYLERGELPFRITITFAFVPVFKWVLLRVGKTQKKKPVNVSKCKARLVFLRNGRRRPYSWGHNSDVYLERSLNYDNNRLELKGNSGLEY